jgi:hypothetical protein
MMRQIGWFAGGLTFIDTEKSQGLSQRKPSGREVVAAMYLLLLIAMRKQ